jgi:hypothetical protein
MRNVVAMRVRADARAQRMARMFHAAGSSDQEILEHLREMNEPTSLVDPEKVLELVAYERRLSAVDPPPASA